MSMHAPPSGTPRAPSKWRPQDWALAGGTGLALLAACTLWFLWPAAPNLALHAGVSASSRAHGTAPEGAVDGVRYGQLGFQSKPQNDPWLVIDLGQPVAVKRIVTYGRGDCCFEQSLPLTLEVSQDGTTYAALATRSRPFSQYEPWSVRRTNLVARFVRLRVQRRAPLVVSEVEVYGQAVR
jgi:hypothetical protein